MNTVEPIKSRRKVAAIKNLLKAEKNPRNYLLFTLGINTALRISDLLPLKIKDILDSKGDIRETLYIRQQKTGKEVRPKINEKMKEAINYYLNHIGTYDMDDHLFTSARSNGALSAVQCWNLINKWCKDIGLEGKYGTHSLRKTWGHMAWKEGCPLEIIMEKLGHTSTKETRKYIGITQMDVNHWEGKISL